MSNLFKKANPDYYDEVYFERGTMVGKSGYTYYRWMPEATFRMAMAIIEYTKLSSGEPVLDFGCAKGFLVKALRYLFRDAYGCDWSKYAIENAEKEAKEFVRLSTPDILVPFDQTFKLCIAKDVLEHIPHEDLPYVLNTLRKKTNRLLSVVPLGDGNRYLIEAYEHEGSHFIREDIDWWTCRFKDAGFKIISKEYFVPGIKEAWHQIHPFGNAVIFVE